MKALKVAIIFIGIHFSLCFSPASFAQENNNSITTANRVGGSYLIRKIEKKKDGTFVVEFHSVTKNGRADVVILESDHVHMGIKQGQTLRISAEVESNDGPIVHATQVLLFLPKPEGSVPIWMLSKKGRKKDLGGASYLEMHAPQSDYVIL